MGRFTVDIGSGRNDLWRVALDGFGEKPIAGEGGGGFEYLWLREREIDTEARDAHSIELEILSELGLVGFGLFSAFLIAAVIAIARARRASIAHAALGAAALAAATYWLAHSSVDWFWPFPALTAPVMAMLGAACVPLGGELRRRSRSWRWLAVAALAALALSFVPTFLSQRYLGSAYSVWRADLERAYEDLDASQALNPLSITPLLAEAVIARNAGDPARALSALRRATSKQPKQWAPHFLIAQTLQRRDPAQARIALLTALELNPDGERILALAERFDLKPSGATD